LTTRSNWGIIYIEKIYRITRTNNTVPVSSVDLRHFVLGLLTHGPLSGYDVNRMLKTWAWLVGDPSFGSLYPALHTLLGDGLVSVDVDTGQKKPSRKVYSITQAGRQVLQVWIDQPAGPSLSLKGFMMRLALASNFSMTGLIAQLHQRRAQVATHRAALKQLASALGDGKDLGQRLSLEYGLALADTELTWLDRTLESLVQLSPSGEGLISPPRTRSTP